MSDDEKMMAILRSKAAKDGVGLVRMADSYLLLWSRQKLLDILAAMDAAGRDDALVLVRHGPDVTDVPVPSSN